MDVKLLKATTDDAPCLLEMRKICFAPHLQRYQDYETNPAMVTVERILWLIENENYYKILYSGVCVGAINIRKLDDLGGYKLHIIYVLPGYQGKGIGQSAICLAEKLFPEAKKWRLKTLEDMPANRHVYEKMGYSFTGKTEGINEKLTLVCYEKAAGECQGN